MSARPEGFDDLLQTMKTAAGVLRAAGVEFMLGGGLAVWARGGPTTDHDVDFLIRPADAAAAQDALAAAGFRPETVPEEWLVKAWDGEVLIDLIFEPAGLTVDDELLERAEVANAAAMDFKVMTVEDVLFTKLNALNEHYLDFSSLLQISRSVREQVEWDRLRERTSDSPYATAFFCLLDELGIVPTPVR
jgi:predicted nucleotidyltransferase